MYTIIYQEESLCLDDICKELGVSNSYFSSIFKKETGKSFVGYLTGYRMEKAARMLVETMKELYDRQKCRIHRP